MRLAHEFLQNFCAGNQQNQALLHKHINLFLNPGVSGKPPAGLYWEEWGRRGVGAVVLWWCAFWNVLEYSIHSRGGHPDQLSERKYSVL